MIGNGRTYLWIPSNLSLSTLDAAAVATINAVHTALGGAAAGYPLVTEQDQNPYVMALNDLDMGGAAFTRDYENGLAVCGPIANMAYLSIAQAALVVAFGGDIEAMPVFFELTDLQLEEAVPAEFPERTYLDANAVEQVHTWETWGVFGASHAPVQYGVNWYRSANYGAAGTSLNASHWMTYRNSGGIVKTLAEFQAIQAANSSGV